MKMKDTVLVSILLLLIPCLAVAQDGLYVSNSTDILYKPRTAGGNHGSIQSVYHDTNARIVGLAIDIESEKIFWTDISLVSRGIYVATLGDDGQLSDVTRIVSEDIGEANGLTVDWVSKHIYWTDTTKRSIELAEYDGGNRRVLTIDGLQSPRGIVADPNDGWLFWNDQGTKEIERSRLDGSNREVIVSNNLVWPNHMVVKGNKLFFVDGSRRKLSRCNKDGSNREDVQNLSGLSNNNPVFGVTSDDDTLYISVWHQGKVLEYASGVLREFVNGLGVEPLFGLVYHLDGLQEVTATSQPCRNGNRAGCSHLCLPVTTTSKRCSCPSFGGMTLQSNGVTCGTPANVMFYVLAGQGLVGYWDSAGEQNGDRYLVGRSLRPVSVAYDPVEQFVYWSDVHENIVHKRKFDGTLHTIFMSSTSHSIGVVDGLAVDPVHRKLYYTNMGEIQVYSNTHAWHKIEFIGLDGQGRKTVVDNVGKPRGLYVDYNNGYLYYTDWGSNPTLVKTELDGSNVDVLRVGLDNPNAVTVIGSNTYVLDSHYKTRTIENYPGDSMDGALYRLNGNNWSKVADLKTPFGMTNINGVLYISDWDLGLVTVSNPSGSPTLNTSPSFTLSGDTTPTALFYTAVSSSLDTSQPCHSSSCEICVTEPGSGTSCTCDTYTEEIHTGGSNCQVPSDFMLIGDYNSVKMVGLDTQTFQFEQDKTEPQVVVEGNSYFSNYVAMTYDSDNSKYYFTDGNRGAIFSLTLGEEPELFYDASGRIIDGIDHDSYNNLLFWTEVTDALQGTGNIAAMSTNGDNTTYRVVVHRLNRPRAIKLHQSSSKVYWTEWGTNPRVARADYSVNNRRASGSNVVDVLVSPAVSQPNGLDIDFANQMMYVGDAARPNIKKCDISGTQSHQGSTASCSDQMFVGEGPQHIFAIKYAAASPGQGTGQVLISDWDRKAVSLVDLDSGYMVDVVTNLMRPTDILLSEDPYFGAQTCPGNHGCSRQCIAYPGGYFCTCAAGESLTEDGKTCESNDAWVELPIERCGSCGTNRACAAQVGSANHGCHCDKGYQPNGDRCQACPNGQYKPYPGSDMCSSCPSGSSNTGTGNTDCTCSGSNAWNWETMTCSSNKPGSCPTGQSGFTCQGSCSNDGACDGAKKCCSECGSNQCTDPGSTPDGQCVSGGIVYQVGSSFKPSPCVTCTCTLDKTYGDPQYGNAVCTTQQCPLLTCEDTVIPRGACCAECGGECMQNPIAITNCPGDVLTVALSDNGSPVTTVNFDPRFVDNCGGDYSSDFQFTPSGDIRVAYEPHVQTVTITARACKQSGSDECVEATCDLRVRVTDTIPPSVTCPSDTTIQISEGSNKADIDISSPEVTDNVCGRRKSDGTDYPSCTIELQGAPRDGKYTVGDHRLTYVVTDAASNTAQCPFTYTIERNRQLTCDVPSVNNGAFDCENSGNSVTCRLRCNTGYQAAGLVDQVNSECVDGKWTPAFDDGIRQKGCAKVESHKVLTSLKLIDLPCPTYSKEVIANGLEDKIRDDFLGSLPGAEVVVTTNGCDDGDDSADFEMTIWISADYSDSDEYSLNEARLQNITRDIQRAIIENRLLLPDSDTIDLRDADVEVEDPESGCLVGEKDTGSVCVACPPGTRWEEVGRTGDCKLCQQNHYQDQAERTYCKKCPEERPITDSRGAFSVDTCMAREKKGGGQDGSSGGDGFPVAVVAGVIAAAVVIIIIIVVVVVICLKRGSKTPAAEKYKAEEKAHEHANPAYDEGVYEEMPDRKPDYESLDETAKIKNEGGYEKIGQQR